MPEPIKIMAEPSAQDPSVCRFELDRIVLPGHGSFLYKAREEAVNAPIVETLLDLPFVSMVELAANTIVVTKQTDRPWSEIAREVGAAIRGHIQEGRPIVIGTGLPPGPDGGTPAAADVKIRAEPSHMDPNECKFTVDRTILPQGTAYFADAEQAEGSPLAEKLLAVDQVRAFRVEEHLVTVFKEEAGRWQDVAPAVGAVIRSQIQSGGPLIGHRALTQVPPAEEMISRIQQFFDAKINPGIAAHGGFVSLVDVKGSTIYIQMGGGCQGCGQASATLKYGVETALRDEMPEVGAIIDITDHAAGSNPYYQAVGP